MFMNQKYFRHALFIVMLSVASFVAMAAPQLQFTQHFEGISDPLLMKNIRLRLEVHQHHLTYEHVHYLYQRSTDEILKAMQPFGYFSPSIHAQLDHQSGSHVWVAHYVIHKGPLVRVGTLDVHISGAGKDLPIFIKYLKNYLPLKRRVPFSVLQYNDIQHRLFETAHHAGFLKARIIQHHIDINRVTHQAHIVLHFDTGPQFYFGHVTFLVKPDHHKLDISFLRRFIPFKSGDHYSTFILQKLQEHLDNSNLFEQLSVIPMLDQAQDHHVPVHIRVRPRRSRQYTGGLGYGTDTGVRGLFGITFHHTHSKGQFLKFLSQISSVGANLGLLYLMPGRNPITDQYRLAINMLHIREHDQVSYGIQLGAYERTLVKRWGRLWQQTVGINMLKEYHTLRQKPQTKEYFYTVYPDLQWTRRQADHPFHPTHGYYFFGRIRASAKGFLSSASFLQVKLHAKMLMHVLRQNRLLMRATYGYTFVKMPSKLPTTLQFYIGGTQTVRGFAYNSIGPGRALGSMSLEYQQHIHNKWYMALFYDAGYAGNVQSFSHLNQSVGAGIVWLSPIGSIELTVAKPLNDTSKTQWIQLRMGPDL